MRLAQELQVVGVVVLGKFERDRGNPGRNMLVEAEVEEGTLVAEGETSMDRFEG